MRFSCEARGKPSLESLFKGPFVFSSYGACSLCTWDGQMFNTSSPESWKRRSLPNTNYPTDQGGQFSWIAAIELSTNCLEAEEHGRHAGTRPHGFRKGCAVRRLFAWAQAASQICGNRVSQGAAAQGLVGEASLSCSLRLSFASSCEPCLLAPRCKSLRPCYFKVHKFEGNRMGMDQSSCFGPPSLAMTSRFTGFAGLRCPPWCPNCKSGGS